ncbi:hypothetical protein WK13_34970 [Burkholderia ubonensis]|uniref:hypothetical protein n=1 Tax=Burkholderia ubonensis TaxID=101571 RepID=UPI000755975A|nr:hypothetical protein [Burkholderia ubonensis]KVR21743.1 hypothetical protein WK13_34970 [Burkholderia ubonensis]
MNDFLKTLTSGLPEQVVSPSTGNVYLMVAEKEGAKLAVSAQPQVGQPAPYKEKTIPSAGLTVRFMEVPAEPGDSTSVFTDFHVRGVDSFEHGGHPINALRGEKHYLPICGFPCSPAEFLEAIEEQKASQKIGEWIKARVAASGGKMTVTDDALLNVLLSKLMEVPNEKVMLFQDPNVADNPYKKAKPAPSTNPSVDEFKGAFGKMLDADKQKGVEKKDEPPKFTGEQEPPTEL